MTTSEYFQEMSRLHDQYDVHGMLELMGEHYGRLEGEFTEEQQRSLGGMGRWAVRMADEDQYQAVSARVRARVEERIAREGLPPIDTEPESASSTKFRLRWW